MIRIRLLALAALSLACKPKHSCEQPGAPVQVQLLAASQPALNPDEDGAAWPTNVRIYELKRGAELDRLEFETVYREAEKSFGESFLKAHEREIFPDRHNRWNLELSPETAHVVVVGLFRRPFGDAWYHVYDVPPRHAVRRCEAEARGDTLPDPCAYLAFEQYEIDGGSFPPPGFDLDAFAVSCAPVVDAADDRKPKRKRKRPGKPKLPSIPSIPTIPKTPSAPTLPQAPTAPAAPATPQAAPKTPNPNPPPAPRRAASPESPVNQ